ncbi:GGDEF domain-containing protein [Sphingobium sp. Ant17]|uniref:GGDEF domain-containing protein n=1 Tax=Sphingobium sp. Ant17 TaxID=1461752 RepID=UPI001F303F8C|nr:GGDEF domain-containing protein [Sphingobium sp. Ant17]
MPDAVYRDLVSTLFTMAMPIMGFGVLYALVGTLIYLKWQDGLIATLTGTAIVVTVARVWLIKAYNAAGSTTQDVPALKAWERRYAFLTYIFALLLAALHIRALVAHEPLVHIATISLIFTFGAGIVSRNASRPRLCVTSLSLVVLPTAVAMMMHAMNEFEQHLHAEFFALQAFFLVTVALMSLQSVRHLYASSVEHLTTKHDLAKLARFDPLTGLPNRLLLRETFQANVQSSQTGEQMAIHYLDLDGFKAINDRYGHPAGDAMLREVARRLQLMIRTEDVACRLGGDEFLLLQCQVRHPDQADLLARRIIKQLSEPYLIDGIEMRITVSVGIAMAPEFGLELERLMAFADTALYRSKAKGKAQVHFCTVEDLHQSGLAVA